MPSSPLVPASAPFAVEQIAALNTVIASSNAEQRAWLSGFLAGIQAANAPAGATAATPAAPPAKKVPLTILFGTESGNSEALAAQARKVANKLGFAAKVLDMADTTPAQVAALKNVLLIAATWGEGDPPQRAIDFYEAIQADDAPRLDGVNYAVLALGDRAYAQFCEIGRQFDERFAALGAKRVADRIECDLDYEAPAGKWIDATLTALEKETAGSAVDVPADEHAVIHVDFARPATETYTRARPFEAEITDHVRLSGSRSTSDTYHLEVSLEGSGIAYEPGDALGIVPENDAALADEILSVTGLSGDSALRAALADRYDITTLTAKQAADYAALVGIEVPAPDWLAGRQVIDLLERAPGKMTAEQLTSLLRPLPPRYYSIASSRAAVGEQADLLVAALRYETHGRLRQGVASVDMTARHKSGSALKVFLRPNPHFRLPSDPARATIMIGPGTGVAPFRGFLQEREAAGATGRNWLVFGHRNYLHDFLYQLDWQDWLKSGVLSRLDVAFSRDQPAKRYVQDALWDARRDLYAWLQDGAALYVCGDANAMAKDVHAMLLRILADQGGLGDAGAKAALDQIRRDGRYLRDVY